MRFVNLSEHLSNKHVHYNKKVLEGITFVESLKILIQLLLSKLFSISQSIYAFCSRISQMPLKYS